MPGLWQNLVLWQRLAVGAAVVALLLGGGLAWSARSESRVTSDVPAGAVCPAGELAAQASPEVEDAAQSPETRAPSGRVEVATFALG